MPRRPPQPDTNGDNYRDSIWVMLSHLDDEIDEQKQAIEMLRSRIDKLVLTTVGISGGVIASLAAIIAMGS
ncbi:hypothetical protein [uncultured Mediterranean phage uvDeep-CGR2-KM24-C26]|nr:hypothetical protein [uncultured Mediterranean phage uvDeep-CGR2-KM24-C26]